jgi:hypothetical protein
LKSLSIFEDGNALKVEFHNTGSEEFTGAAASSPETETNP